MTSISFLSKVRIKNVRITMQNLNKQHVKLLICTHRNWTVHLSKLPQAPNYKKKLALRKIELVRDIIFPISHLYKTLARHFCHRSRQRRRSNGPVGRSVHFGTGTLRFCSRPQGRGRRLPAAAPGAAWRTIAAAAAMLEPFLLTHRNNSSKFKNIGWIARAL